MRLPWRAQAWSLKLRLLMIVLLVSAATLAIGAAAMYWMAAQHNDELSDQKLADLGRVILRFADHELREIQAESRANGGEPGNVHWDSSTTLDERYQYQIWSKGKLLLRSAHAPADRMLGAPGQLGFGHVDLAGVEYCTFVTTSRDGVMEIHMAEAEDTRLLNFGMFSLPGMLLILGAVALLMGAGWMAVGAAMRSMSQAQGQLAGRGPFDLQPLRIDRAPRELVPLTAALNDLFLRFGDAMRRERDFTAVAAHEMRTPMASLRTMAQVALRARTDQERGVALNGVVDGVDRCSRLINQLLTLARVDASGEGEQLEPVDLDPLLRQLVDELQPQAQASGVQLLFQPSAHPCSVFGRRFAIHMLARNLVDNAVHYSPRGGRVRVGAWAEGDQAVLCVDDSGPGIPAELRSQAFERFRRLRSEGAGVGLGLAIVQSVSQAHRAQVQLLDAPEGGLRVLVQFPGVAPAVQACGSPQDGVAAELADEALQVAQAH